MVFDMHAQHVHVLLCVSPRPAQAVSREAADRLRLVTLNSVLTADNCDSFALRPTSSWFVEVGRLTSRHRSLDSLGVHDSTESASTTRQP